MNVGRHFSVQSQSDTDARSVESVESFDEAYNRIVKLPYDQEEEVIKHAENVDNDIDPNMQVENAEIRAGPVFNISEEFLKKGGGLHNVFNYQLCNSCIN